MEKMMAFCGLDCYACDAFIATKNNDDNKRAEVARQWSELNHADIKPEDIHCDGCLSEGGNLFHYCTICEIRKCGLEKGIETCAHCPDYSCEKLDQFFQSAPPECKTQLDTIRHSTM